MKAIITLISLLSILSFSSCFISDDGQVGPVGPQGPAGPQGPQGAAGESGFVFEYTDINFTAPDYEVFLNYPDDFESLPSDVAIVFLLWGVEEIDGEEVEIWRQLPQTLIVEEGLLQYNFDFSQNDVRLFMDADFPLDLLTANDTDEWIARVVVVPGNFWNGRRDFSDYYELEKELGLPEIMSDRDVIERRK